MEKLETPRGEREEVFIPALDARRENPDLRQNKGWRRGTRPCAHKAPPTAPSGGAVSVQAPPLRISQVSHALLCTCVN